MEVKLIVLEGVHKGREIPLPETIFLIGRDSQCHLRPHCQLVSMLHCAIAAWAGKVRVRDLNSRNGTRLNGKPIQGEVAAHNGDRLQVGTLVFSFAISAAPKDPSKGDDNLDWLLDSPADSSVLSPNSRTMTLPASAVVSETLASAATKRENGHGNGHASPGSRAVSGGEYLRNYLEERKRSPSISPET